MNLPQHDSSSDSDNGFVSRIKRRISRLETEFIVWKDGYAEVGQVYRPYLRPLLLLSLISAAVQSSILLFPVLVSEIAYGFDTASRAHLYGCVGILALVNLAGYFLGKAQWNQNYKRIAMPLHREMLRRALEKVGSLSPGRMDRENAAIRGVVDGGVSAVTSSLDIVSSKFIPTGVTLAIALGILFSKGSDAGYVLLVGIGLYAMLTILIIYGFLPQVKRLTEVETTTMGLFWERIRNMSLVVFCGKKDAEIAKNSIEHIECTNTGMDLWRKYLWQMALVREPIALVCIIGFLVYSIELVFAGQMSAKNFIVVMWLYYMSFSLLGSTTGGIRDLMERWQKIRQFQSYLDTPDPSMRERDRRTPDAFHGIVLREACFKYDPNPSIVDQKWAILDVNIAIRPGEFVAIVGPSGSGKSTVFDLINGSEVAEPGAVLVSGIEMRNLNRQWWWRKTGYVPQQPKLWNKSMIENIVYDCDRELSMERILEIMEAAQLMEFTKSSEPGKGPRMYEPIGEDGCKLSGGERKRLAIARALAKDPEILLFDEAMSGLDNENESLILDAIRKLAEKTDDSGRRRYTIIVIAHKIVTAAQADRVFVFEKGRVVGQGTHRELILSCPVYDRLARLEMKTAKLDETPVAEVALVA